MLRRASIRGLAWSFLTLSPTAFAQTVAHETASESHAPATGLLLQGRMLTYVGTASGSDVVLYAPAGLGAGIGYRGRGWDITFTPSYTSVSAAGAPVTTIAGITLYYASSVAVYGLSTAVEVTVASAAQGRVELSLLAGFGLSVYSDAGTNVGFGVLGGINARYWPAHWLGLGVSFGESYAAATLFPEGSDATRQHTFATFGAIDVSVVFGGGSS